MSDSQHRSRLQRPKTSILPALPLLLGLGLQSLASSGDPIATAKPSQATQAASRAVTTTPVAPASSTKPSVQPAANATLATTAEVPAAPRKKVRATTRKDTTNRLRQAVEQVAVEREAEKREQKIRDLLARAQLDYVEGRVFEPANDNAAARYAQVLEIDATQSQALEGTRRIADILAVEAENMALAGDQARTLQYILQIRALQPNHPSLQGLDARYQALLANPVELSARQQDRYIRSAQNIDEAYEVLKNQPDGLQSVNRAVIRYDRATRLVEQAPGLPKLKDRIILAFPAAVRAELAADEPRQALRVVQIARKRGWFTAELEPLEEQAKKDIRAKWLFSPPEDQP